MTLAEKVIIMHEVGRKKPRKSGVQVSIATKTNDVLRANAIKVANHLSSDTTLISLNNVVSNKVRVLDLISLTVKEDGSFFDSGTIREISQKFPMLVVRKKSVSSPNASTSRIILSLREK